MTYFAHNALAWVHFHALGLERGAVEDGIARILLAMALVGLMIWAVTWQTQRTAPKR